MVFLGEGPCLHQGKQERHGTGGCCWSQKEWAQSGTSGLPDISKEKNLEEVKGGDRLLHFCLKNAFWSNVFVVMDTL